jgi:predicted Zn-dependent peptidase
MEKRILLFLLTAFGLISAIQAQMTDVEFEQYTLDNGLEVILHQDKSAPVVAVSVMYHVGSKNEDTDRTGFAHFFEHLLFEGTENIERGEFDKYVERAGGTLNANTSFDRTYYYELLPANQLELGLWLESERMLHAVVDEVGIETQRSVVKEEKRQRVDNQPYGTVMQETFSRAFQKHPYQWMPIGSMEHLDAASEEDYKNFYETFYVPNNAVLSIAGNLDIEQAKKWVEKYFGTIPRGDNEIPTPELNEPSLSREIRDTIFDEIQLPAVIQAYRIPEQTHPDYYALDLLATVLSGGESSRMYKRIVDDEQLALAVFNFAFGLEHYGLSINYGIANMGVDPSNLEAVMDEELEKVKNELITEREYQKLINQKESQFVSQNASMAGIAENLATYHMFHGDANLINDIIQKYRSVSREDIRRVAQEYLNQDRRVVLYYLPKPADTQ